MNRVTFSASAISCSRSAETSPVTTTTEPPAAMGPTTFAANSSVVCQSCTR